MSEYPQEFLDELTGVAEARRDAEVIREKIRAIRARAVDGVAIISMAEYRFIWDATLDLERLLYMGAGPFEPLGPDIEIRVDKSRA